MYCYCNNGLSMRAVDPGYEPQEGEVLFEAIPTPEELSGAFPGYAGATVALATANVNAAILAQMDALDGGGQARAIRGAVLAAGLPASADLTRLQALEAQVAALRATLR